jgi:hypothetical protein
MARRPDGGSGRPLRDFRLRHLDDHLVQFVIFRLGLRPTPPVPSLFGRAEDVRNRSSAAAILRDRWSRANGSPAAERAIHS